ncbi:MAG: AAA family ATPase [Chthoniobacterales bacterium]
MSSSDFVDSRGLLGNVVAAKAQLYNSAKLRGLLFSLQALSMEFGGMHQVALDLIEMFPDRLCTRTMSGLKSKGYSDSQCAAIESELAALQSSLARENFAAYLAFAESESDGEEVSANPVVAPKPGTPEFFASRCRSLARQFFHSFLVDLCINPALDLERIAELGWAPAVPYFRDPIGALTDYLKKRGAEHSRERVTTTIGDEITRMLDHALSTRRMVIIEGESGSGKTHQTESWCFNHIGEARFVTLSGITNRTIFFQKLATALGLSVCNQASAKLQARIEAHLTRTKLMLVIDEAHFLWPQHRRNHSAPELIDWVNTIVNQGVPVALICTDQFAKLKAQIEKQVGWNSDQLMHRAARYCKLPELPTKADLHQVAENLLRFRWCSTREAWRFDPTVKPDATAVRVVALYGDNNLLPLGAVRSIIDDARRIAHEERGRDVVALADIKGARDAQENSDLAIRAAFAPKPTRRRNAPAVALETHHSNEQMSNSQPDSPAHERGIRPAPTHPRLALVEK